MFCDIILQYYVTLYNRLQAHDYTIQSLISNFENDMLSRDFSAGMHTACPEPFSTRYFFFFFWSFQPKSENNQKKKKKKQRQKRYGLLQLRELPHIFDYTDDPRDRQIDIKLYSCRRRCLFFFFVHRCWQFLCQRSNIVSAIFQNGSYRIASRLVNIHE